MITQTQLDDAITALEASMAANKAIAGDVLALVQAIELKLANIGIPGLDLENELARINAIKVALDAAGAEGKQVVDDAVGTGIISSGTIGTGTSPGGTGVVPVA